MFSPAMPASIVSRLAQPRPAVCVLMALLLCGCALPQPLRPAPVSVAQYPAYPTVKQWLDLYSQVDAMTPERALERLGEMDPPESAGQRFYSALLHQRVGAYSNWIAARDRFEQLNSNTNLGEQQRHLAGLMRDINQLKINAATRETQLLETNTQLQLSLDTANKQKAELEQKIQILTDIESAISTRKEE